MNNSHNTSFSSILLFPLKEASSNQNQKTQDENKEIISNSINSEQHVYDLSILIDIDKINHHDKEDLSNAEKNKYDPTDEESFININDFNIFLFDKEYMSSQNFTKQNFFNKTSKDNFIKEKVNKEEVYNSQMELTKDVSIDSPLERKRQRDM